MYGRTSNKSLAGGSSASTILGCSLKRASLFGPRGPFNDSAILSMVATATTIAASLLDLVSTAKHLHSPEDEMHHVIGCQPCSTKHTPRTNDAYGSAVWSKMLMLNHKTLRLIVVSGRAPVTVGRPGTFWIFLEPRTSLECLSKRV